MFINVFIENNNVRTLSEDILIYLSKFKHFLNASSSTQGASPQVKAETLYGPGSRHY